MGKGTEYFSSWHRKPLISQSLKAGRPAKTRRRFRRALPGVRVLRWCSGPDPRRQLEGAVGKITGNRKRAVTAEFQRLQSHFLFEEHFCLVRRLNEKVACIEILIQW